MSLYKGEQGSITIVALLILVVLTILGVTITKTTTLDLRISTNELMRKQDFYVAEAGVYREAAEVGEGRDYVVTNINQPLWLAIQRVVDNPTDSTVNRPDLANTGKTNAAGTAIVDQLPGDLAGFDVNSPRDRKTHLTNDTYFNFDLRYVGFFLPPKGYSVEQFSRYDFDIAAWHNNVDVHARFYRIGPKAK